MQKYTSLKYNGVGSCFEVLIETSATVSRILIWTLVLKLRSFLFEIVCTRMAIYSFSPPHICMYCSFLSLPLTCMQTPAVKTVYNTARQP
jgi:hypothetical protein